MATVVQSPETDLLSSGSETGLLSSGSEIGLLSSGSETRSLIDSSLGKRFRAEDEEGEEDEDEDEEDEDEDEEDEEEEDELDEEIENSDRLPTLDFEFGESDDDTPPVEDLCQELPRHRDDETWPYKMTRDEIDIYFEQFSKSQGYNVDLIPKMQARKLCYIQPAITEDGHLDDIIRSAKAAVKRENRRRRLYNKNRNADLKPLKLHRICKAMYQFIAGQFTYFLTIKVLEGKGDEASEKTYEASIRFIPLPKRGHWGEFREPGTNEVFSGISYEEYLFGSTYSKGF